MKLTNPINNPARLFISTILIGVLVTFFCYMLLLANQFESMSSGALNLMTMDRMKLISMQVVSMLSIFILPPILFALFSKNDFLSMYQLDKKMYWKKYLIAFLLSFILFPVLINIQYFVTQLPMSESLKTIAESQKAQNEKVLELFLNYPGIPNLFLMVLIIGIGAGLTEELFFRGLLMPLIARWTKSTMLAIVFSGVIFSVFHANVYDFLPITVVGILFGYLYSKTHDLKLNIFIHAVYNSFQVVLNYLFENKFISQDIDKIERVPFLIWIAALALVFLFTHLLIKKNADFSITP